MSRPLRIELPDGLYHVTSRGDRREPIFKDDGDCRRLLEVLAQGLDRFDASVHAYCLMGNHYHFVIQTHQANLSRLMRHVNGVYSQAFNRRHQIVGHLFQGRFKAIHVDRDAYFLDVCRYVELNPVRAGLAVEPSDWRWSSYRAHVGIEAAPSWLDTKSIKGYLLGRAPANAEDARVADAMYEQLVQDGIDDRLWERGLRQEIYLGEARFIERIQESIKADQATSKDIPEPHLRCPGSIDWTAAALQARETAMLRAHIQSGRSLSSIAREWNLSVSRVSRLIKRAEVQLKNQCGSKN